MSKKRKNIIKKQYVIKDEQGKMIEAYSTLESFEHDLLLLTGMSVKKKAYICGTLLDYSFYSQADGLLEKLPDIGMSIFTFGIHWGNFCPYVVVVEDEVKPFSCMLLALQFMEEFIKANPELIFNHPNFQLLNHITGESYPFYFTYLFKSEDFEPTVSVHLKTDALFE